MQNYFYSLIIGKQKYIGLQLMNMLKNYNNKCKIIGKEKLRNLMR